MDGSYLLEIRTSESVGEIASALAAAEMPRKVARDATNPHFRSRYATLAAISEAVLPIYAAQKIVPLMSFAEAGGHWILCCRLLHASGEWIELALPVTIPEGATPQQVGSAITYARRYLLGMVSGVAADDDDDANSASEAPGTTRATPPPAPAAKFAPGVWPLGKHKGTALEKLPVDYLQWAADNLQRDELRAVAAQELERRRDAIAERAAESAEPPPPADDEPEYAEDGERLPF